MFDVEVQNGPGWATDLSTGSRRYARERAQELMGRGVGVRALDHYGRAVNFERNT